MGNPVNNLPTDMQVGVGGPTLAGGQSIADCIGNMKGASTQDAITASTTQTQAGGTLISTAISRVTVANSNDAVTLAFAAVAGRSFSIINDSGQIIQLFPKLGDKLNDASTNAAVTIADNTVSDYYCPIAGKWFGGATTLET